MFKLKKFFTIALVALMIVGLSACKEKEPEGPVYDYDFTDYLDISYIGPNEFADLEISLKDIDSDDFSSDTEFIKIKKFMTNLFPYIVASKTSEITNGDVIQVGISSEYGDGAGDLNINLEVHSFEVNNLPDAIYYDLFDSDTVTFYGLEGSSDVLYKINQKSTLSQNIKDNLTYTVTIDTEEVEEKVSVMSIKASLKDSFLKTTKYSDTETYFKSLGYIVDLEGEKALKETVSYKDFEQLTDKDLIKEQLSEKIKEQGDIDGYTFSELLNVQKTQKAYIYDLVAKYVNGDKVAYVEFETKLAYLNGEIKYLSFNKLKTVNERFATEALDNCELLFTFDTFKIEEEPEATDAPVETTETTEKTTEE